MKTYSRFTQRSFFGAALVVGSVFFSACNKDIANEPSTISNAQQENIQSPIPISPGEMVIPSDNPMTYDKVELGRMLFSDKNIGVPFVIKTGPSAGQTTSIACASCHAPSRAFSDDKSISPGVDGKLGTRNAPALINVGYNTALTWDGRFNTLEKHAPGPMFSQVEMGNNLSRNGAIGDTHDGYDHTPGSNDTLLLFKRLKEKNRAIYITMLKNAYQDTNFTLDRIAKAISCFERTLVSTGSPFDEYNKYLHNAGGSKNAINESAKRGFKLFTDTKGANCVSCHSGYNFSDGGYHNNSLTTDPKELGRGAITNASGDNYKFKVPTLRNVAITAPYMHNGSLATLQDVLNHYNNGGSSSNHGEYPAQKLNLSTQDMQDIIAFLNSLTDNQTTTSSAMLARKSESNLLK